MRGVGYAATEIIGLIVLAALIGFAIGWLLRRFMYDVDVSAYEARVDAALDRQQQAEAEVAAAQARLNETASVMAKLQSEVAQVEADASGLEAEVEASRTATRERDGRIETLESELAGLRAEAASNADAVEERNTRIELLESEIAGLRADLDAALATGGAQEKTIGELQAELAAIETLRGEADARAARIAELEVLVVEKEPAEEAGRVAELETELATANAQLAAARARLEHAGVAASDQGALAFDDEASTTASPDTVESADAASGIAAVAARTSGSEPPVDDDLKKVRGIGPKLEGLLKSLGITSFRQIARFTPEDVAIVTEALNAFPGRIERDGWIAGAAEQHEKAYGEPV